MNPIDSPFPRWRSTDDGAIVVDVARRGWITGAIALAVVVATQLAASGRATAAVTAWSVVLNGSLLAWLVIFLSRQATALRLTDRALVVHSPVGGRSIDLAAMRDVEVSRGTDGTAVLLVRTATDSWRFHFALPAQADRLAAHVHERRPSQAFPVADGGAPALFAVHDVVGLPSAPTFFGFSIWLCLAVSVAAWAAAVPRTLESPPVAVAAVIDDVRAARDVLPEGAAPGTISTEVSTRRCGAKDPLMRPGRTAWAVSVNMESSTPMSDDERHQWKDRVQALFGDAGPGVDRVGYVLVVGVDERRGIGLYAPGCVVASVAERDELVASFGLLGRDLLGYRDP